MATIFLFASKTKPKELKKILHHENRSARETAQHSVHLTGGYAPRFQAFSLAQTSSVKMALSCPTRQQVTQAVGRLSQRKEMFE